MSRLDDLRRERPRSRLVRASGWAFAGLALYAWLAGDIRPSELLRRGRWTNVRRFLTEEALPEPLREGGDLGTAWHWTAEILTERGAAATLATLSISVLAIALAGLVGALLAPFASHTLAATDPYLERAGGAKTGLTPRRLVTLGVRLGLAVARAIPEYVLAFLLLAVFGPTAWPAVLALAIHNAGILGRLGAECIENVETPPLRALRGLGATRTQIALTGVLPLVLGRYLLYFFYRFEACVRESTVLGMLGIGSLGYWIQEARAKQDYDELLLFVALGAGLVMLAEIVSYVARGAVRRA